MQQRLIEKAVEPMPLRRTADVGPHLLTERDQPRKCLASALKGGRDRHPDIHAAVKRVAVHRLDHAHPRQLAAQDIRRQQILSPARLQRLRIAVMHVRLVVDVEHHAVFPSVFPQECGKLRDEARHLRIPLRRIHRKLRRENALEGIRIHIRHSIGQKAPAEQRSQLDGLHTLGQEAFDQRLEIVKRKFQRLA